MADDGAAVSFPGFSTPGSWFFTKQRINARKMQCSQSQNLCCVLLNSADEAD